MFLFQIAKDPKQALEKARQLWDTLSENEPENQARPATLEQLIVMLTRESARRVVHFVNFTRYAVGKLPVTISKGVNLTTRQCRQILDLLIKVYGDSLFMVYGRNYFSDSFVYDDFTDYLSDSQKADNEINSVSGTVVNASRIHLILLGYFHNSPNNF